MKVYFPALLGNYGKSSDQQTETRDKREVNHIKLTYIHIDICADGRTKITV